MCIFQHFKTLKYVLVLYHKVSVKDQWRPTTQNYWVVFAFLTINNCVLELSIFIFLKLKLAVSVWNWGFVQDWGIIFYFNGVAFPKGVSVSHKVKLNIQDLKFGLVPSLPCFSVMILVLIELGTWELKKNWNWSIPCFRAMSHP